MRNFFTRHIFDGFPKIISLLRCWRILYTVYIRSCLTKTASPIEIKMIFTFSLNKLQVKFSRLDHTLPLIVTIKLFEIIFILFVHWFIYLFTISYRYFVDTKYFFSFQNYSKIVWNWFITTCFSAWNNLPDSSCHFTLPNGQYKKFDTLFYYLWKGDIFFQLNLQIFKNRFKNMRNC